MRIHSIILTALLAIILSIPVHAESSGEKILQAIVKLHTSIPPSARTAKILGQEREGSGVLIDRNGYILTIGYLILEAERVEATDFSGKQIDATVVGYDHKTGFGLVRSNRHLDLEPMELGESTPIKVGDPLLVAGHGGPDAVHGVRVVSRKDFAGYWEYLLENAIFTAPPYSNYGGAALIGRDGRLLGIGSLLTQVVISEIGSMPSNMFVPIDRLKSIIKDLKAKGRSPLPSEPWLGLHAQEVHGRVFVIRTTTDGPAFKAGIKTGDIILMVDEKPVNGLADFYRKVWAVGDAGDLVPLTVLQETQVRKIQIRSRDRSDFLKLNPKKKG